MNISMTSSALTGLGAARQSPPPPSPPSEVADTTSRRAEEKRLDRLEIEDSKDSASPTLSLRNSDDTSETTSDTDAASALKLRTEVADDTPPPPPSPSQTESIMQGVISSLSNTGSSADQATTQAEALYTAMQQMLTAQDA
ncbi:hypothetical protein [Rhodovulum sulfidophilum]|uniref:hypothetical protein n=1 Tax=Rhodovulum sulfidophilum TaxID=35806 RepID=UPI001924750C|nr:hypothetical protein [Rhodovulum sulfidophilum]MBL3564392.1 hypothetical protein [Rhodovulum sulfidophilum]MCE8438859.1 hypothetical protein [Rhodovulum sulfidophilum]